MVMPAVRIADASAILTAGITTVARSLIAVFGLHTTDAIATSGCHTPGQTAVIVTIVGVVARLIALNHAVAALRPSIRWRTRGSAT